MAIDHAGVAAELSLTPDAGSGRGVALYRFAALGALYEALERVYALAASLPDAPLAAFAARTRDLPRATEAEQLMIRRIGQDVFRESLMAYWGGRCPLTGIAEPELLRASHIIPGPSARATLSASTSTTACSCRPSGTPLSTAALSASTMTARPCSRRASRGPRGRRWGGLRRCG